MLGMMQIMIWLLQTAAKSRHKRHHKKGAPSYCPRGPIDVACAVLTSMWTETSSRSRGAGLEAFTASDRRHTGRVFSSRRSP